MNIVFWALILLATFGVWLSCSSSFWNIGDFFVSAWMDAKNAMTEENEEDNENE